MKFFIKHNNKTILTLKIFLNNCKKKTTYCNIKRLPFSSINSSSGFATFLPPLFFVGVPRAGDSFPSSDCSTDSLLRSLVTGANQKFK